MDQNFQPENQFYSPAPAGKKGAAYYRARARAALKPAYWIALLASLVAVLLGAETDMTGGV